MASEPSRYSSVLSFDEATQIGPLERLQLTKHKHVLKTVFISLQLSSLSHKAVNCVVACLVLRRSKAVNSIEADVLPRIPLGSQSHLVWVMAGIYPLLHQPGQHIQDEKFAQWWPVYFS